MSFDVLALCFFCFMYFSLLLVWFGGLLFVYLLFVCFLSCIGMFLFVVVVGAIFDDVFVWWFAISFHCVLLVCVCVVLVRWFVWHVGCLLLFVLLLLGGMCCSLLFVCVCLVVFCLVALFCFFCLFVSFGCCLCLLYVVVLFCRLCLCVVVFFVGFLYCLFVRVLFVEFVFVWLFGCVCVFIGLVVVCSLFLFGG